MRCSVRRCRGASFPDDARCAVCGLAELRVLRWLSLADGKVAACGNCATIAGRLELTLEQLSSEVLATRWGDACRRLTISPAEISAPASSERRVA
jgi:hypothetical protein